MAEKSKDQAEVSRGTALDSNIASPKEDEISTESAPWYQEELGAHLAPTEQLFYANYVGLEGDELVTHLKKMRNRAWPLGRYPCVGSWTFLHMPMIASPAYSAALARVCAGATVLDIGCGFGQNLRRLIYDGATSENFRATDISSELWNLGYDLFRDRDSMKALFFEGNFLSDGFDESEVSIGKVDVVLAYSFLHLFGWEEQVKAVKKMVRMSRNGTVILGSQMGKVIAAEKVKPWGTTFYHTPETFTELWRRVGSETGTQWEVKSCITELGEWGLQSEDITWMDKDNRALDFVAERIPNGKSAL